MQIPIPVNEEARLAELARYGVLDSEQEASFDDLTKLAAYICQTPVCLISLVAEDRQWFKSRFGIDLVETPRDISLCTYTILHERPLIVEDATTDPRFQDNPVVKAAPGVRFYAGAPLVTPSGHALGSLCVIDYHPRVLSEAQIDALMILSKQVIMQLELKLHLQSIESQNKALEQARDQALVATRAKSHFIGMMSHEVRTPLNGIVGLCELALGSNTNPEVQEFLDGIKYSADALQVIIDDVLDISRIEAGKFEIASEPFSLRETLDRSLSPLMQTIEDKEVQFALEVSPTVPDQLIGDGKRLGQVLINLLSNAIKFVTTGGEVLATIELGKRTAEGVELKLAVKDDGPGIAREDQTRIFEAFTQLDEGAQRHYGGTGLGLTIASKITALMGGTLTVESIQGQGSTFATTLTFKEANPVRQETATQSTPTTASGSVRVLLVEDNLINRKVATALLQRKGHTVVSAENGRQAVELYQTNEVDIILMDIQMPELDGIATTALIREYERTTGKRVPIIALTASVIVDERDRYLAAGMDSVIGKPINSEKLFKEIDLLCNPE